MQLTDYKRKSWNNLHALNEWRIVLNKKDSLSYHQKFGKPICSALEEGKYVWDEKFKTYESTVFGHPGSPKSPDQLSVLGKWNQVDFRINFENDGLRVQADLEE